MYFLHKDERNASLLLRCVWMCIANNCDRIWEKGPYHAFFEFSF